MTMQRNEVFERLNKVFREVFDDETITLSENTTANDIEGWDSLTHINVIFAVQEEFDVKFSVKEIIAMKNVGKLVDIILGER